MGNCALVRGFRQLELFRGSARIASPGSNHAELHNLAGGVGVCRRKFDTWGSTAEWLVGAKVEQGYGCANVDLREIYDYVGSFGRSQKQLLQFRRLRQKASVTADLPKRQILVELQN